MQVGVQLAGLSPACLCILSTKEGSEVRVCGRVGGEEAFGCLEACLVLKRAGARA